MTELDKAMTYIFWLSLILVVVAYYAGSVKVLNSLGTQVGSLIMTSTGRDSSGKFAAYPQNAPA
jgi:hypothetical protein